MTETLYSNQHIFATVAKGIKEWDLLLELYDDQGSAGGDPKLGTEKLANLIAASVTEKVVQFNDGYENRIAGTVAAHDVIVENPIIELIRPGEGIAQVTLREIS